jgi:2-polyprenyl-3-methyl-5-hydroxy-6-metoxy-1,4-benzoquinol methylase
MRRFTERELVHEKLGERFKDVLSDYDTHRRLEVLVGDFLGSVNLSGKRVLDVGTGLGFFAEALQGRGAHVTAVAIGKTMLDRVRSRVGCECRLVDAMALGEYFGPESFDIVLSSECIEHTPSPNTAIKQMVFVLKRGGYLSLSTPNIVWQPIVRSAAALRLRAFDGLENFSSYRSIRSTLEEENMIMLREKGLHLFPFQLPLHRLSTWVDNNAQFLRPLMINICILAKRR